MVVGTIARGIHFVALAMLLTQAANGAITVECVPIGGPYVTGGQIVEVECFLSTDVSQTFSGAQLDLPCALLGKSPSLGSIAGVALNIEFSHYPELFFLVPLGGGVWGVNNELCAAYAVPFLEGEPRMIAAGTTVYFATFQYLVSDCAAGIFNITIEDGNATPEATDGTRFLDFDDNTIPYDAISTSLTIPTGNCCQETLCVQDNINEFCCTQTYPGASFFAGRSCDDVIPCGLCISDAQCDDSDFCNGPEACDSITGDCVPGTPLDCDDGMFCNGLELCDSAAGCLAAATPCAQGLECDEARDECFFPGIPTVSAWGLAAISLCLAIGAKMRFRRPTCG
jgi:hypothetical protein